MPSTRKSAEALAKKSRRGRIAVPVGTSRGAQPVEPATNVPTSTSTSTAAPNSTTAAQRPANPKARSLAPGSPPKATARSMKAARKAVASDKSNDAPRRTSALDAAAQILARLKGSDASAGVGVKDLIDRLEKSGLWKSPGGKTPAATLYSALIREIKQRKGESRFRRIGPGRFVLATGAPRSARSKDRGSVDITVPAASKPRALKRQAETVS